MTATRPLLYLTAALCAFVAMGQDSCDTESGGGDDSGQEPAGSRYNRPFHATGVQVRLLLEEKLGAESGSRPRVISADCELGACAVKYRAKEIILSGDEVFEDQFPVWKVLFTDRSFGHATLVPVTTIVSAGGKESSGPVARVTCGRDDHEQIDWDNVDVDGFKQICTVVPLVDL